MNVLKSYLRNVQNLLICLQELLFYFGISMWVLFRPKAALIARLLAAESQLAMYQLRIRQKKAPKPLFTHSFRVLWVVLSKVWKGWEEYVCLMQPATVKRWHKNAFRLYWRWKSRKRGRPTISKVMQELIRTLSRENPLWGAERIRDTLLLLGFNVPCLETIRKYMVKPHGPPKKSTNWLPFLRNHLQVSWAMDFFTVTTVSFKQLYVFIILDHARREVVHFATTYNPTMTWVIQQLREATPFGIQPEYIFRDNDGIYGNGVKAFLESCGIEEIRTAFKSPWQNPYVERFIGTLRGELLDHVIILNQCHLQRLLKEYIAEYYHIARPHQGLGGDTPIPYQKSKSIVGLTNLVSYPVVGGLHHRYERVAA